MVYSRRSGQVVAPTGEPLNHSHLSTSCDASSYRNDAGIQVMWLRNEAYLVRVRPYSPAAYPISDVDEPSFDARAYLSR